MRDGRLQSERCGWDGRRAAPEPAGGFRRGAELHRPLPLSDAGPGVVVVPAAIIISKTCDDDDSDDDDYDDYDKKEEEKEQKEECVGDLDSKLFNKFSMLYKKKYPTFDFVLI